MSVTEMKTKTGKQETRQVTDAKKWRAGTSRQSGQSAS